MTAVHDSQALGRARTILAENRTRLQNAVDELESRVAHTGESWRGPAGDTFRREIANWRTETSQIVAELDEFVGNLATAQARLGEVDSASAQSMSRLGTRLAGS